MLGRISIKRIREAKRFTQDGEKAAEEGAGIPTKDAFTHSPPPPFNDAETVNMGGDNLQELWEWTCGFFGPKVSRDQVNAADLNDLMGRFDVELTIEIFCPSKGRHTEKGPTRSPGSGTRHAGTRSSRIHFCSRVAAPLEDRTRVDMAATVSQVLRHRTAGHVADYLVPMAACTLCRWPATVHASSTERYSENILHALVA